MQPFELVLPKSLDEAISVIDTNPDVLLWGGGTSLTILMKQGLFAPTTVAGLEHVRELYGIKREEDGSIRLGSMVRLREIELSPFLASVLPSLPETARVIANVRIRNVATLGGHLVHADPAQDLPPMLLALDASVRLKSKSGERVVPLTEFFVDTMETAIHENEILVDILIPNAMDRVSRYVKFRPRSQDDYCTVGVAASLSYEEDGHTICHAAIAVGGAGPTASRFPRAELRLIGRTMTTPLLDEVAEIIHEQVDPWDDARGSEAYKRDMAAVWMKRVLASLDESWKVRRQSHEI